MRNSFEEKSIGIVSPQNLELEEFTLINGQKIKKVNIRYETYGELEQNKSNAILIFHGISGNHHAAGYYETTSLSDNQSLSGWWEKLIGYYRAIDLSKYFVICGNVLGGCSGTTGPSSINPDTNKPYNLSFPFITIADMVNLKIELLKHLGIKKLYAAIGSSMGGMKVMYLATQYPHLLKKAIIIASTTAQSTQSLAFSEVARQAIMRDSIWNKGNYEKDKPPRSGLGIARMLSHITYLSDESISKKFGRKLQNKEQYEFTFDIEFAVESYLSYQGNRFVNRFDANSYLYNLKST